QHNYLDRGYNTIIYQVVTSFVVLNMNKNDLIQFVSEPWRNDPVTDKEYEELYYLAPEMKKEYELELKIYLSSILKDLIAKKDQEINAINQSIGNQKGVENTFATLQAESAEELA
ncbi:26790_t:CDS:2, partial [Racocetra persica]